MQNDESKLPTEAVDNELKKYEFLLEEPFERIGDLMYEKSPGWEKPIRGWNTNGMGDVILVTAFFAIAKQDFELLLRCTQLLKEYKRWPDFVEPGKAERKRLKKEGFEGFRGQRSMTRDPYIATIAAIALMEEGETVFLMQDLKIPFWMNRSWLYCWKKCLENHNSPKWKDRFEKIIIAQMKFREFTDKRRPVWLAKKEQAKKDKKKLRIWWFDALQKVLGFPGFTKHLIGWMAYTIGATKVQQRLAKLSPSWNYGLLLLCNKPTMYLAKDFIEGYISKEGYTWSGEILNKREPIPVENEYKMDKDILDYLWSKYKFKS